jgi:hypothetical protein
VKTQDTKIVDGYNAGCSTELWETSESDSISSLGQTVDEDKVREEEVVKGRQKLLRGEPVPEAMKQRVAISDMENRKEANRAANHLRNQGVKVSQPVNKHIPLQAETKNIRPEVQHEEEIPIQDPGTRENTNRTVNRFNAQGVRVMPVLTVASKHNPVQADIKVVRPGKQNMERSPKHDGGMIVRPKIKVNASTVRTTVPSTTTTTDKRYGWVTEPRLQSTSFTNSVTSGKRSTERQIGSTGVPIVDEFHNQYDEELRTRTLTSMTVLPSKITPEEAISEWFVDKVGHDTNVMAHKMTRDKINNPHYPSAEIVDASIHMARNRLGQSMTLLQDLHNNLDMYFRNVMKHSEAKGRMQMGEFAMVQVDGMLNARDVQAKLNIYNNRIAELTNGVRNQYELNIVLEQQLNAIPEADEESKMAELRGQIATLQQELRTVKRMLRNPDDLKNRLLGELLNNIDGELHRKTRNILEEACALRMRYYESEYKVPEVEK